MVIRVSELRVWVRARLSASVVVLLLMMIPGATQSLAGDVSAQPSDTLYVTNPTTAVMGQGRAATAEWLNGLHISGYASQTFGMWQNPAALRDFTPSRNNLAVSRTLLQIDENYRLNENNAFFMREWFVYEPPYAFDSANNKVYDASTRAFTSPFCLGNPGCAATVQRQVSYGHFMNDWYNTYQVRDGWWENKLGPLTTFIGNQIVVWGQSLSFRVGDVINPTDTSWAFGFANLEQSRNAQWMVHPILNLPEVGSLSSNFLEVVIEPGFAPQWWASDYGDGRYSGQDMEAGRVDTGAPSAMHGPPSARFDVHYDNSADAGLNAPTPLGFIAAPFAHEFWSCAQLAPLVKPGFIPRGTPRGVCNLALTKGNLGYGPFGNGSLVDIGPWRIPGMQPRNWNEGVRLHTVAGSTEYTVLYYNDNVNRGLPGALRWKPFTNLWTADYPDLQEVGVTADRPLPMPPAVAEYFPAVFRGEALYTNHMSFTDMRPTHLEGERYSDTMTWMTALDLDEAYTPWLTSTGNLTTNVEVFDNIILDRAKTMTVATDVSSAIEKNQVSALLNLGTSWWWEDFAANWTMIFAPKGRTFLLFPSVVLNPPWTKNYFIKLQAIEVLGGDRQSLEGGLFKGQSLLTAEFQYNFNLL